jgi:hypothetical protein
LKDLSIDEVCPIFERINSSGTKLSTYDLMVAATWSESFDLNVKVASIQDALEAKGYGTTNPATILKSLAAIELASIQDKTLRSLRDLDTARIAELTAKTKQALLAAVDCLSTQFYIRSWDFLSYEAILVIAAYLFAEVEQLNAEQARRLRQWFWRASFGERYKVGGENFVSRDMNLVADFVLDGTGTQAEFGQVPEPNEWGQVQFRSNVARSRALILLLASAHPKNLVNGLSIDIEYALSEYNKKEYHHVYPRAHLKRLGRGDECNVLSNIIMLTSRSNKQISDADPKSYVLSLAEDLGDAAEEVFLSNLLPPPNQFDYSGSEFADFLHARGILLTNHVKNKLLR